MVFKKEANGVYSLSGAFGLEIGTASRAVNYIDYSMDDDQIIWDEKALLSEITHLPEKGIIILNQLHEDRIVIVDSPIRDNFLFFDDADGIITNIPEVCIVIRSADCVPVYAFDSHNRILGAAHSGWRGCMLSISKKLIIKMKQIFSSNNRDIHVFILPSIGPESYVIGNDVASLFERDLYVRDKNIYLDLWKNIERSLIEEGIPEVNIFNSRICTLQNNDKFFSYRNKDSARNLNYGFIKL
ncbi:MAG: peptidoglycan editing factor PgeF [Spirochaetota bacterium]|nr:peptidoglycan editing factor PgeF [Spirochaetota bacterium]